MFSGGIEIDQWHVMGQLDKKINAASHVDLRLM